MRLHQLGTAPGPLVLAVQGEIDPHSATVLEHLCATLAQDGTTRLVLDLSGVTFMDSVGINTLLHTHRTMTATGGWLRLICTPSPTRDTLHLLGLDKVITLHNDLAHALHPPHD